MDAWETIRSFSGASAEADAWEQLNNLTGGGSATTIIYNGYSVTVEDVPVMATVAESNIVATVEENPLVAILEPDNE